ncbi:MAB_1171c family putative transporter [Actinacidiphila acididurans]|uniref:DUF6545 domain-containing protein n=1 Tax=Actinacidiphila acididurans TaxID=2784346 RepID=A0ABS2U411_9ACTN|nr:MAB_1171c family putative transporter [Actinacidiphila acididurans]MBM9508883.1 hypothetical protein [Actinacidiphila acididurans]
MPDLVTLLAAAVFLAFAFHQTVANGWAGADPGHRSITGFAACMGASLLFSAHVVVGVLHRLGPVDAPLMIFTHELRICAQSLILFLALSLKVPVPPVRSVRRQLRLTLAVAVVAAVILLTADTRAEHGLLVASGGRGWLLAAYNVLFATYGSWCLLVLIRELTHHTRRLEPGPLRTGLRLMVLAAVVGTLWTLWVLTFLPANLTRGLQDPREETGAGILGLVTAVLATAGATATLWGDRWTALRQGPLGMPRRSLVAYRSHRSLEPLWSALHDELPQIALNPSPAHRLPGLRRAEFALYRRVIEIRDGHLALRPYFPRDLSDWPDWSDRPDRPDRSLDGTDGTDRTSGTDGGAGERAILEAAMIAAALENKRVGRPQSDTGPRGHAPQPVPGTVDAEVAWLLQVAAAFTTSPAVAVIRDRARTAGGGPAARRKRRREAATRSPGTAPGR